MSSNPCCNRARILAIGLNTSAPERWADFFLSFSPHLVFRRETVETEHRTPLYWFFLDLGVHRGWIENRYRNVRLLNRTDALEACLLNELIHSARSVRFANADESTELNLGIADSSAQAQALAKAYGFWISAPGCGARDIGQLGLQSLLSLEGLKPWERPRAVSAIVDFFSVLGFSKLSDLSGLTREAFQERWGQLGDRIYTELVRDFASSSSQLPREVISPYFTDRPIETQVLLDFPISIVSLLLHSIEESMRSLFLRLQGRRLNARKVLFKMHLEYSDDECNFSIEPASPSRDLKFYMALIERRLESMSLLNPVRDIEIHVQTTPDNEVQDGFEDASASDRVRLNLLSSLLKQEGLECGFAHIQQELVPEQTWTIESKPPAESGFTKGNDIQPNGHQIAALTGDTDMNQRANFEGYRVEAHYSSRALSAPRPTLIFPEPEKLTPLQLQRRRFLTTRPVEKIETNWWSEEAERHANPKVSEVRRAYYFAETDSAPTANDPIIEWIYEDLAKATFHRHGVFD